MKRRPCIQPVLSNRTRSATDNDPTNSWVTSCFPDRFHINTNKTIRLPPVPTTNINHCNAEMMTVHHVKVPTATANSGWLVVTFFCEIFVAESPNDCQLKFSMFFYLNKPDVYIILALMSRVRRNITGFSSMQTIRLYTARCGILRRMFIYIFPTAVCAKKCWSYCRAIYSL